MINPTEYDKAYAAGILDGEGCIDILQQKHTNKRDCYTIRTQIYNTNRLLIDWFGERWNGTIIEDNRNRRICYCFRTSTNFAYKLLEDLIPYLIIKKDQAELAMEFQKHILQHKSNMKSMDENTKDDLWIYRKETNNKLSEMKHDHFQRLQ